MEYDVITNWFTVGATLGEKAEKHSLPDLNML